MLFAGPLQVAALLRVQVGEGLDKEAEKADFAAEVAAMAAGGK
jgi:translation elongation factor EF-Ts